MIPTTSSDDLRQINTTEEIIAVLDRITVGANGAMDWGWKFEVEPFVPRGPRERRGWLLYVTFNRIDVTTGGHGRARGRDHVLWEGITITGIAKTAWVAVRMIAEHELMHAFAFDGRTLFDPHASVSDLLSISERGLDRPDDYNQWQR